MSQEPASKRARRGTPMFTEIAPPSTWIYNVRTTAKSTSAYITNADGSKVRMQLPRCRVPFGIQESLNATMDVKDETRSRPNLELNVSNADLLRWASEAESAAIEFVANNSKELMKKVMKKEFVEQLFRPVIPPSRGDYNPLFRCKVTKTGTYATQVRVVTDPGSPTTPLRHREGTISDIERGDEIIAVVDVSNIWFANNSAGLTIVLAHALLYKKSVEVEDVFTVDGVAGLEVDNTTGPVAPAVVTRPSISHFENGHSGTITVNLDGENSMASDPFA